MCTSHITFEFTFTFKFKQNRPKPQAKLPALVSSPITLSLLVALGSLQLFQPSFLYSECPLFPNTAIAEKTTSTPLFLFVFCVFVSLILSNVLSFFLLHYVHIYGVLV